MNKNVLHNPWVKAIVFLGILAFLIHLFSIIPVQRAHEKNKNYWPYFYNELPENSVDIVYMGNSHSNTTFIPEVIDDILDVNSIHVNTSGESIHQTIFEYREVLRRQNPKVIVIEANPIYSGLDQDEIKSWNYSFFYSMPFDWRKLLFAHQYFQGNNLLHFYMPFTLFHSNWKHPEEVIQRVQAAIDAHREAAGEEIHIDLPFKGYVNYFHSLSMDVPNPEDFTVKDDCNVWDMDDRLDVVTQILEINKESKGNLLFIESPQYVNKYAACQEQVIDHIEEQGGEYEILFEQEGRSRL